MHAGAWGLGEAERRHEWDSWGGEGEVVSPTRRATNLEI